MHIFDPASKAVFTPDKPSRVPLASGAATRILTLCLEPGQGVPEHAHPGCELSLHVLQGQLTLPQKDGNDLLLHAGQICFADGASSFAPRNDSDERARVLIHLIRYGNEGGEA